MANNLNIANVEALQLPFPTQDLRNGQLDQIAAVVPRAAIPPAFFWLLDVPVVGLDAISVSTLMVRNYAARMEGLGEAAARDKAIVLAAVRAGARAFWALQDAELSQGEVAAAEVTYVPEAVPAPPAAAVPAHVTAAFTAGNVGAADAAWNGFVELTAGERETMQYLVLLGIAAPPTQGWSLVKNGHHFLSNAGDAARAGWNAVRRQWASKLPATVSQWVTARNAWFDDVAFHKACHPIEMAFKIGLAQAIDTPRRLKAADFGSAAVRLPATEPDFEYAKVTLAVLAKVSGTITGMGGQVNTTALAAANAAVMTAAPGQARSNLIAIAIGMAHTRDPMIAVAAGILQATLDASGVGRDTLLTSFGMRKLIADYPAEASAGANMYRAWMQRQRDLIAQGTFTAPVIVF
jgi:hypothetical protein